MDRRLKTFTFAGAVLVTVLLIITASPDSARSGWSEVLSIAWGETNPPLLSQYDDQATLLGSQGRKLYVTNNDPNASQLIAVTSARHGLTEVQGNAVRYVPETDYSGPDTFTYTARNGDGETYRARVQLEIQSATAVEKLLERMAMRPEIRAQVQYAAHNGNQRAAWAQQLEKMRADPWLARGFATVEAAKNSGRPVDLYVLIGDELMQGVTESGEFNDPGESFAVELDRIWDTTPDQSNSNTILTLNCSVADTSIVQWSNLYSPREELPSWLRGERDANLSEGCLFFLDWMLSDPGIPVALRGLVIGFGTADLSLAQQESALPNAWRQHLLQLVDLYRGSYGSDLAVLLIPPLKVAEDSELITGWKRFNRILRGFKTYNLAVVESRGLPQWRRDGKLMLTDAGQRALGKRLARVAHERWMAEWRYTPPESKPILGVAGDCSRETPCFPGTNYLIEPGICTRRDFFRPGGFTRLLCDQYGNSLHALASACNHCIDLEHIAGTLGVGLVKTKTGQLFRAAPYIQQTLSGKRVAPLPYQNPYVINAPRPCGYFDRESSTYLMPPGSYRLRLESRLSESCTGSNRAACGLLLSPASARREVFQREVSVTAGNCTEVLAQRAAGESLTCGQQITRDTVLGADMHCMDNVMDGLWIIEDGITFDLNGYTIFGKPSPSFERYGPSTGIKIHAGGVTVTNGVIEGWDTGIGGVYNDDGGTDFSASNLTIRSLAVSDQDHQLSGISLPQSRSATIENVLLEFQSKFHSDGIMIGHTDVVARNLHQFGGASAFTVGPYQCDHEKQPINVEFYDSVIRDTFLCSFFAQCITSATVAGNEFNWTGNSISLLDAAPSGFCAHAGLPKSVKEVDLTGNFIRGAGQAGLSFEGVNDSRATKNYIVDSGLRGVDMGQSLLCSHQESPGSHPLPDWFQCFGASGNLVADNWVTTKWSSLTDLYEHPRANSNTWRDNVCETTDGETIPPCLPEP